MRKKPEYDRFAVVKRGYDPEAVEQHLDEVAAQTDNTLDEAAQQIVTLQSEIDELQRNEEAVQLTILAATETKEKMLDVARQQADALRNEGRKAGDAIITEARMQAFQVVTEARKEAESVVAEAMAQAAANARTIDTLPEPPTSGSDREQELEAQIARMQAVIAGMESQLLSRPTPPEPQAAPQEPADEESEPRPEAATPIAEPGPFADAEDETPAPPPDIDEDLEVVVTDTAPADSSDITDAEPEDEEPIDSEARTVNGVRRSFYSRRSAKLPRIGVEGGRGAMAAVAGLRPHLSSDETDDDTDQTETEEAPELETV